MRITGIKTFVVGMPGHNTILVKIETDEDLFGIGEASLAGRDQGVIGVLRHFESLLIGRDPSRIEDIWQELYRNTFWRGGPILLSAISGIDTLWATTPPIQMAAKSGSGTKSALRIPCTIA